MVFSISAFCANEIKYDYEGLTIKNNKIQFDNVRWNLKTDPENRSTFTGKIDGIKVKVEVVRDSGGNIVGVGDSQGTYMFKDAIAKADCAHALVGPTCIVNHEVCAVLKNKLEKIAECVQKQNPFLALQPESTNKQKEMFPQLSVKSEKSGTAMAVELETELASYTMVLAGMCEELSQYSKPELTTSGAAKNNNPTGLKQ